MLIWSNVMLNYTLLLTLLGVVTLDIFSYRDKFRLEGVAPVQCVQ